MGALEIVHHPLTDELGEAIWIDRTEPHALADRHALRLAIDRAARREYDRAHAGAHHRIEEHPRAVDVDVVITPRSHDQLPDIGERREMHDRIARLCNASMPVSLIPPEVAYVTEVSIDTILP